jgi:diguanylate cyclase (GGDEF)-like protein
VEEIQTFERSLRRVISALLEIALSSKSLGEKLSTALEMIIAEGPAVFSEQGCIFLADNQAGNLTLAAGHHLGPSVRRDCSIVPFGHCICGRVAEERRIIHLDHAPRGQKRHGHFCAPIIAEDRLLGILNVYTLPGKSLTDQEEEFLSTVTHSLALMILRHHDDVALKTQHDLLGSILDHIPYRVFWKDRNSVYLGGNKLFARDAGVASPADLVGLRDEDLAGRCKDAASYLRRDQVVLNEEQPLRDYEELRCLEEGREAIVMASLLPLHDAHGAITGVLGIYDDVTAQRLTENRLRDLTLNDQLTGLPNQALIKDRIEQAVIAAQRQQSTLGVICLNLDNFRQVNNSLGHATGDEILRLASQRLQQALFSSDTLGRMGGDSFVLLLKTLRSSEDITLVLRKLRHALDQPFLIAGREIFLSASMGVSLYPHDGEDASTLLKNADTALHQAKQKGRNGYQLYSPTMNASALMRLSLESQLRRALDLRQFEVYYQPQVTANIGRLVGAEALIRWRHPELGLVAPGDFISLAEETGLIVEIGAWVINEACLKASQWQKLGMGLVRVAVNLSPRQFQHHDIVATVCTALLDSGLDPQLLELEITESAVMYDSEQTAEALNYFREMGVRIAIDDFGTGYSSLSQLKKYPITLLKVDRMFIQGIGSSEDDHAIVTAVIAMARKLGLKVLAEGVETRQQWEFLRNNGCDELQGYLFSRPLALQPFEELLASGKTLPTEKPEIDKILEKTA